MKCLIILLNKLSLSSRNKWAFYAFVLLKHHYILLQGFSPLITVTVGALHCTLVLMVPMANWHMLSCHPEEKFILTTMNSGYLDLLDSAGNRVINFLLH